MIDSRNMNSVWASILAETLRRLGLTTAVICPGSRSTPLTLAFAQNASLEAIPILDERSASFFALGMARKSRLPVVIVCTSGTAGANFYPAVIEAKESRVPLLVLTADRPPELRNCHSGQTIDQLKLYGSYPNWQTELALPSLEMRMLSYLRQTLIHAWERALSPVPGPVHLNIPFRDPLAPIPDPEVISWMSQFQLEDFLAGVPSLSHALIYSQGKGTSLLQTFTPLPKWQECERGIIIAGYAQPPFPQEYVKAVAQLSKTLGWPVLAEGLSPLRNYAQLNPYLISTYDLILRNQSLSQQLKPEMVIQLGELPTSKELRAWLELTQPQAWVIDPSDHNLDALHGRTTHLRLSVEQLAELMSDRVATNHDTDAINLVSTADRHSVSEYLQLWCTAEAKVRAAVDETMAAMDQLFEGKAAWLLSQILPPQTLLFVANSMPVRDVEFFWAPNDSAVQPFFNRGANGIDGTLSTALGIAHRSQRSVILTGDLALLHDTNGFLLRKQFVGHLTIVLINNDGGGIFEMLPISQFELPFEKFFATPQGIDFAQLCLTYEVEYELMTSWAQLKSRLNPLPETGIRILELQTNRKVDAQWRQENLGKFAANILS